MLRANGKFEDFFFSTSCLAQHTEALEPFTRYSLTLHTRPDKNTCNMKSVNHSESTYGTMQFYFTEGCESAGVNFLFIACCF